MDTIKNYLENMFLHLPNTPEVLRAKAELEDMMEDKYYELLEEGKTDNEAVGVVISEFGNLKELSKELGIGEIVDQEEYKKENIYEKVVGREEAREYLKETKQFFKFIGVGTMLCIYSPIMLILLEAFMEAGFYGEKYLDKLEVCIGVPFLFIMIAIAVGIFIYHGMKYEKYDYLKKEIFSLDIELEKDLKLELEEKKLSDVIKIIVGVVLCILSVLPPIILDEVTNGLEFVSVLSVVLLLFMVGIAVFLFITSGGEQSSYQVLLQEGDYTVSRKKGNKLADKIGAVYWPVITCIYLAWSFITMNWGFTWIIWPVAGVFFGVIAVICKLVEENTKN